MAPLTDDPQDQSADTLRPSRRDRRSPTKPAPAEVAAESASIYPDTFDTAPTPEEVAAEAYAIYQARGGEHGRHLEDWLEAERRVSDRLRQRSR